MWKSEEHRLALKYDILCSLFPLVKHYFWLWRGIVINSKLTVNILMVFKHVQVGVENCSTLTFSIMECLRLDYTLKSLFQKISTFSGLPEQKFRVCIRSCLKEGHGDKKFLRCPDFKKKIEVLRSEIWLDKVGLDCSDIFKAVILPTKTQSVLLYMVR